MGVGGVTINMGSSKGQKRNSNLGMHLFYQLWWYLQSKALSFLTALLSRIRWPTSRILLTSLALYSCYWPLWAVGIMGGAGLRSPGRKKRWRICNEDCHQHSVDSVKLPNMLKILRLNYRNSYIILKVYQYYLIHTRNLDTRIIITERKEWTIDIFPTWLCLNFILDRILCG